MISLRICYSTNRKKNLFIQILSSFTLYTSKYFPNHKIYLVFSFQRQIFSWNLIRTSLSQIEFIRYFYRCLKILLLCTITLQYTVIHGTEKSYLNWHFWVRYKKMNIRKNYRILVELKIINKAIWSAMNIICRYVAFSGGIAHGTFKAMSNMETIIEFQIGKKHALNCIRLFH